MPTDGVLLRPTRSSARDVNPAGNARDAGQAVPEGWREDVSRVEALLRSLRARRDPLELAEIVAIATERGLRGGRRGSSGAAQALLRGKLAQQRLKESDGGSVSAEEARAFLGHITRQAVLDRHRKGRLLGWRETRQNAVRFPVWQFTDTGLLPGFEEVLALLRSSAAVDDWAAVLFFLNPRSSLGGQRPLDALRAGKVEAVKRAARGFTVS